MGGNTLIKKGGKPYLHFVFSKVFLL